MMSPNDFRFFLDSGAFSAWSQGKEIDIDEYIAFIKANIDHIEVYASLDSIGGVPGRAPTKEERNEGARKSWDNYLYMKSEGLDPIPVFHCGEDWKWLDNMLEHGCTYIGLGGMARNSSRLRIAWLDEVFTRITDSAGHPLVKTHGFGMTAIPLIFRYPWYSVDSTSWFQTGNFGGIMLPRVDARGEFRFDCPPLNVTVSHDSPNKNKHNKSAWNMSPSMKEHLDRWLKQVGVTLDQAASHYYYRDLVNIAFFNGLAACRKEFVFDKSKAVRRKGFF